MEINVTDSNYNEVAAKGGLLVLDFWAEWCGPCRALAPAIKEIADEYAGKIQVGKVNVDDNEDLSVKFGIRNIPTVIFVKDGQVVDKSVGAVPKSALAEKIDALL